MSKPRLIVGLGNPGPRYYLTRHNLGALALEVLVNEWGAPTWSPKFEGLYTRAMHPDAGPVHLLFPQTYMNLSGRSVAKAARFLKIPPEEILVLHDEVDLPPFTMKLKIGGGTAGHNGLGSIVEELGSKNFLRLRLGIGHPGRRLEHYVLQEFSDEEKEELDGFLELVYEAVNLILKRGPEKAMTKINARKKETKDDEKGGS